MRELGPGVNAGRCATCIGRYRTTMPLGSRSRPSLPRSVAAALAIAATPLFLSVGASAKGLAGSRRSGPVDSEAALASVVRSGGRPCSAVALTFDLCPVRDPGGFDGPLVQLLRKTRTPATFFASGRWMERHPERVRELLAAAPGFELGTHGMRHAHLPRLDADAQRDEIAGPIDLLHRDFGTDPKLFRPPYGEYDETAVRAASALGQTFVLWSIVSGDPTPGASRGHILGAVTSSLQGGAIVVFHANGKGAHTREVVETLIREELPRRGLVPTTVSELLRRCPVATSLPDPNTTSPPGVSAPSSSGDAS